MRLLFLSLSLPLFAALGLPDEQAKLADTYVEAIEKLNAAHLRKPGTTKEAELAARLPRKAQDALKKLLGYKDSSGTAEALERCARAALDLDRVDDFDAVRERLQKLDPARAGSLGVALSRARLVLRGENGLDVEYLEHFAEVMEDVLAAYDEVFGFAEFSKVPGKKLRVRVHLEQEITRPPHFAPQFAYHSEIDFPVVDPRRFCSPTSKGQFLLYGLCHELGHVVAMWGDRSSEEDHHAWAHYTGVTIVEHLAEGRRKPKWLKQCTDVRWRSLGKERKSAEKVEPGLEDRDRVLALLIALHDLVGPKAIGAAINQLDEKDSRLRINQVRYYRFKELRKGLEATLKSKKMLKRVRELLP